MTALPGVPSILTELGSGWGGSAHAVTSDAMATRPVQFFNMSASSCEFAAQNTRAAVRFGNGSEPGLRETEGACDRLLDEVHALGCDVDDDLTVVAGVAADVVTAGLDHPAEVGSRIGAPHHLVIEHHRRHVVRNIRVLAEQVNHRFSRHRLEALRLDVLRAGRQGCAACQRECKYQK